MATTPSAQGIMDLPENEDMAPQAPSLSLNESYDAVITGLRNASPQAADDYEQTMASSLPPELMEMSAEDISSLLQVFQYLQDNPEEYAQRIAELIADGVLDEGDLPPEYDPEVLATIGALLLQALKTKQGPMTPEPQGFARGGIADAARLVASQGRSGDTMLAHITPQEAQLLRSRGGMGTINPATGLREYGFFKSFFRGAKKAVKSVVKVAKKIVSSKIGKIVATVALAAFLGPAAGAASGMFGLSTAGALAAASGATTLLAGGDIKQALIAGATGYFGAPGGTVASYVGQAGITNAAANAAITAGITGTGAALLQGQNLKDSVKAGLVQGAIGGGTQLASSVMGGSSLSDAFSEKIQLPLSMDASPDAGVGGPGSNVDPVGNVYSIGDARLGKAAPTEALGSLRAPNGQAGMGLNMSRGQAGMGLNMPPAYAPSSVGLGGNNYNVPADYSLASGMPASTSAAMSSGIGALRAGAPSAPGGAAAPYTVPGIGDSAAKFASGAGDFLTGDFSKGYDAMAEGLGGIFSPGPTSAQELDMAKSLSASNNITLDKALGIIRDQGPGVIRTYGPAIAAGMAATKLMGGFDVPETPPSELQRKLYGTPGLDLINANPRDYLIQDLPGVKYDERGNIIGSTPYDPSAGVDPRVAAGPQITGTNLMNSYAPPTYAPTGGMGGSILQPYNTPNMYANLMQPRLYADGGEVHPPVAEFKPEVFLPGGSKAEEFVPASPVDQRFYDSQQYRDYQAKVSDPFSAYTQAIHNSPYFGRFSSGQGGVMDAAYENYLANRAPDPVSVPAPDPIAGDNQIAPPSPPPTFGGQPLPSSPPTFGGQPLPSSPPTFGGQPLPSSPPTFGQPLPSSPPTFGQPLPDAGAPSYPPPAYAPTRERGTPVLQPYNNSDMYSFLSRNLMGTPNQAQSYDTPNMYANLMQPQRRAMGGMMGGGIANLAQGGYPKRNGQISGPGTETSDDIPAMLSDGEFVMTAEAVRGAGGGSRRDGAKKMYALMHQLERNAARG